MRKLAERNNGYTYVHQYELEGTGKTPYLSDRGYDSGMKYIGRLPGITPPESDSPAWRVVQDPEISDTNEQDTKHTNAEITS
jgi:hypothetical protein